MYETVKAELIFLAIIFNYSIISSKSKSSNSKDYDR